MQAGRPSIVSATGTYLDVPDDAVLRVAAGPDEPRRARDAPAHAARRRRAARAHGRRREGPHRGAARRPRPPRTGTSRRSRRRSRWSRDPAHKAMAIWGKALADMGVTEDDLAAGARHGVRPRPRDASAERHRNVTGQPMTSLLDSSHRADLRVSARHASPRRSRPDPGAGPIAAIDLTERTSEAPQPAGARAPARALGLPRDPAEPRPQGAEGQVHGLGPRRGVVDPEPDRVPRGLLLRHEGPAEPDPRLPGVPALGAARVEPVLRGAPAGLALGDRQREPREEGRVPARDPARCPRSASPSSTSCSSRRCSSSSSSSPGTGSARRRSCSTRSRSSRCSCSRWRSCSGSSALNVRYRDVGHLLNLGLLVWFWMTPIVYQAGLVQSYFDGPRHAGPVEPLPAEPADADRARVPARPLRRPPTQDGMQVLPDVSVAWSVGVLGIVLVGLRGRCCSSPGGSFFRMSGDFAEEL